MSMPMLEKTPVTPTPCAAELMPSSFVPSSRLISLIPVVVTLLVTAMLVVFDRELGRTVAMI
jgi:hypothetical protein